MRKQALFISIFYLVCLNVVTTNYTQNVKATANDCQLEPTGENYIGVRYKALLAEDKLPKTEWMLLFGGNGFTRNGEYEGHFINLMIKGSWVNLFDDGLCSKGLYYPFREIRDNFTIGIGIDDYEDWTNQDNDIAIWTRDPDLFPRYFGNIDSNDIRAPDFTAAEYQVDKGGTLEGREVEVILERAEITRLPSDKNYFIDPDNDLKPNSQADIQYRHWVATLIVPSLGVNSSVDFYINADQGDKILGQNTLNFMWENPDRTQFETDRYKVILYDMQVKTTAGVWKPADRFLVDYRTPLNHLPITSDGELVGGYRKVNYKNKPALEVSFGYGYTDYVRDGNLVDYEPSFSTKGVIDLNDLDGEEDCDLEIDVKDASMTPIGSTLIFIDDSYMGITDYQGKLKISNIYSGYHSLYALKSPDYNVTNLIYLKQNETLNYSLSFNDYIVDYKKEYENLGFNYKELESKYSISLDNYEDLITKYDELTEKYKEIIKDRDTLQSQFVSISRDNDVFKEQIRNLEQSVESYESKDRMSSYLFIGLGGLTVISICLSLFLLLRRK